MTTMNMIEIERVLRELRLSGMAATLQTRLLQAQELLAGKPPRAKTDRART